MPLRSRDEKFLLECAELFQRNIISKVSGPITFRKLTVKCDDTLDGGWVVIAVLQNPKVQIQLYYDTYARLNEKCLWVGFYSARKPRDGNFKYPEPEMTFTDSDSNGDTTEKFSQLRIPLQAELFGKLIREDYGSEGFFLGKYYVKSRQTHEADIDDSVAFIIRILADLPGINCDMNADHYSSQENRLKVFYHLRRERDPHLAYRCKVRDEYRCQVCRVRLDEVYGDVAKWVAEAHHVIPLSELEGIVDNNPDNLRTVCPNCHRVLHKMPGNEADLVKLRSMFDKRTKKKQ